LLWDFETPFAPFNSVGTKSNLWNYSYHFNAKNVPLLISYPQNQHRIDGKYGSTPFSRCTYHKGKGIPMPVSKKQLRANRRNAQKCTGPKSVEGKQMASRNAVKYGLYSQDIIITSHNLKENKEEYDLLLSSLLDEFQPQTGFQLHLVHKIANSLWRSRRAIRAETAEITDQLDNIDIDASLRRQFLKIAHQIDGSGEKKISRSEELREASIEIARQSIPDEESSIKILRYEMRLDRQLTRAYKLLCQLQDRQNRNQTNADGPIEIPVPVYRCPAVYGDECVQHRPAPDAATEIPESMEDHNRAARDAIESRPRGAGHPVPTVRHGRNGAPGGVTTAEEGFERPTVDAPTEVPVPTQNRPSPRPPLPQGEGPRERESTRQRHRQTDMTDP
jgi:hypothetical protein